jgi:hypothetical protein
MASVYDPTAEINEHLATVWRTAAYLDHPLEWWIDPPVPDELRRLHGHGIEIRRRRPFGFRIILDDPYCKRDLIPRVDRLVIQHGGVPSRCDIAVDLCTNQPVPLDRALKNPNHQLRLYRGRAQRPYKNSAYLAKWGKGKRRPPRNGIVYIRRSKVIRNASGIGYPAVHYELRAARRFIYREQFATMMDVIANFRTLLERNIIIRDHRRQLWTCPGFVESCGLGIRVSGLRAFCSPV